ncbi:hypothetical protein IE81DRAFT_5607 [Ceraceosorus guamensis]|uniref:Uncharacterized protein n=1 Tax=Ceraceosorus guamensis TaxID=1522189 RepID=A0A316W904_9BASI|nr:hypothetical protein IE81DRAFT_5607 [Ceraceosorus guamensis]PWN46359.1 hypothetical protein IE81DRAFT_5607 [Ceraceosorus guamensis]
MQQCPEFAQPGPEVPFRGAPQCYASTSSHVQQSLPAPANLGVAIFPHFDSLIARRTLEKPSAFDQSRMLGLDSWVHTAFWVDAFELHTSDAPALTRGLASEPMRVWSEPFGACIGSNGDRAFTMDYTAFGNGVRVQLTIGSRLAAQPCRWRRVGGQLVYVCAKLRKKSGAG